MFLTFEGIEGCGKSTQMTRLAAELQKRNVPVVTTREPGGTLVGAEIRKLLLDSSRVDMAAECELLLYFADRAQHLAEIVRPALMAGKTVLCDRFVDSTIAYQGYGRGLDQAVLQQLKTLVLRDLSPDLTFIFDLPAEVGLGRARARHGGGDRIEKESLAFHERIRDGFLKLAADDQRFVVIAADRTESEIAVDVLAAYDAYLKAQS